LTLLGPRHNKFLKCPKSSINPSGPCSEGICFTPQDNPRSICFYDFATKHTREIFKADKDLAEGMSVSPDGRYMLYSQLDENNSSIMLVNNFR
jgi:hypothetical protein